MKIKVKFKKNVGSNDKLLFSLSKSKKDFIVQPFKGDGKGGQKKNKTMSACRIIHPASGAVSECQEERSFEQNKKKAFKRIFDNEKFNKWFLLECSKKLGLVSSIEEQVEKQMNPKNLKIEKLVNGCWVNYEE